MSVLTMVSSASDVSERVLAKVEDRLLLAPPAEGRVRDHAVQVFIVAVALLLAFGIAMSAAVALYCIKKGFKKVDWYGPNGWKVWQMKVQCSK